MITSRYLLSTTPSNSSIGGLMMPSAPWVTATCESSLIYGANNQGYHLPADLIDGRVHERYVELTGSGELVPRRCQAALHDVGGLGAAAGEPADQFRP